MLRPSPENAGSVSVPALCIRGRGSPPLASMVYNCEPPSRLKVTARVRPSGAQAGAPFGARKMGSRHRPPPPTASPKTTGARVLAGAPPGRGDDRFGPGQRRLRVLAIGVGHPQAVARAGPGRRPGHIGDARGENAA